LRDNVMLLTFGLISSTCLGIEVMHEHDANLVLYLVQ
jgi:hypothetical protein